LGVATGFGVSTLSAESSLQTLCGGNIGQCPLSKKGEAVPVLARRDLDRNLFTAFTIAGGASLLTSILGLALSPRRSAPAGVAMTPLLSRRLAGVAAGGAFP